MFILYIDASGVPDLNITDQLYAMVGICVHEGTWFALEKRVSSLKSRYELSGHPFELHAKDFCVSIREQNEIPNFEELDRLERRTAVLEKRQNKLKQHATDKRKTKLLRRKYRSTDAFIHLTRKERSSLLEDALDLVGSHDGIRLFGEVLDKTQLIKSTVTAKNSIAVGHTFTQLITRFDAFLTRYNREGGPGSVDNGLVMMDREPTYESLLNEVFLEYRTQGHPWGRLNHVIEAPFFVDSTRVSAVQAVDLCSYAVRRYVERADQSESHEKQNFLRIYHKFDRQGPRLHGLRHFCAAKSCQCLICKDRGHSA